MSNILAYIASAPHEITKAIDLSPRLTMTNGSNGVDNAVPSRLGYIVGKTTQYDVYAIKPAHQFGPVVVPAPRLWA